MGPERKAVSGLRLPASVTGGGSFQVFVTEASGAKTLVRDGSFANSSRRIPADGVLRGIDQQIVGDTELLGEGGADPVAQGVVGGNGVAIGPVVAGAE